MGVFTRKILMLHGHAQNAEIFCKRTAAIRKACSGQDVEFVYVDAPHILLPADIPGGASTLYALGASEASAADPSLMPRAWWSLGDRISSDGIMKGLATLMDVLRNNEFEGVFGFSQGASMAAVLSALLERPYLYPPFLVNGEPPHPPFKFCVAFAGWLPPCPLSELIFNPTYSTSTLFVLGKTDVVVVEELSEKLIKVSSNHRVEMHNGGHFVPSTPKWQNFFRNYLQDPEGDVPSPCTPSIPSCIDKENIPGGLDWFMVGQ